MNCKPGDLAYIAARGQHEGKIVRVLSLDPAGSPDGRPLWLYEGDIRDEDAERYVSLWDCILRPIRDADPADVERAEDFAHA